MKPFNLFSVLALVAVTSACGSSNQTGYNSYGYNTGYGTGYGYSTSYPGAGGQQTPLYSNGQLVGYKTQTPVLGGFYSNITGTTFQQSAPVNAGDRISVNLMYARYSAGTAYCDGGLADKMTTGNQAFPLNNVAISLNGQQLSSGSSIAQSGGTLSVSATLNPITVDCGWLFKHRSAQVLSYNIDFGGAAVSIDRCTNPSGASMTCPY